MRAFAPSDDAAAARNQIHQPPELQLDGSKIGIDVCVVVFERGDDQFVGMVVQELRGLVEECGVVFVAFDDELFPAAEAIAAVAEIRGDAADQEIRPPAGDLENPGEHGGGGGLCRACRLTTIEVCPGMK